MTTPKNAPHLRTSNQYGVRLRKRYKYSQVRYDKNGVVRTHNYTVDHSITGAEAKVVYLKSSLGSQAVMRERRAAGRMRGFLGATK